MAWPTPTGNAVLNKILRNEDFVFSSIDVSLHEGPVGENGANEITGGSYSRQTASWSESTDKESANNGVLEYEGMPQVEVTHFGLWSGSTFVWGDALASPKVVNEGDTFRFPVGAITASVD